MAKVSAMVGLMLGIVLLVACPDGSSSGGGGGPSPNVSSGYKFSAGLGDAQDDPLVLFPGESTSFKLQVYDPDKKINSMYFPPDTLHLKIAGSGDTVVSGDVNGGFLAVGLSDPDARGNRSLTLELSFASDPGSSEVHPLVVEAHEDEQIGKVTGAISGQYYWRRAKLPSLSSLEIAGTLVSEALPTPTVVSKNFTQEMRLGSVDPDGWVGAFRLTVSDATFTLSGTGVGAESGAATGVYLADTLSHLAADRDPHMRGTAVKLAIPDAETALNLKVEVLDRGKKSFFPPLEKVYHLESKDVPSGIGLAFGGRDLGGNGANLFSAGEAGLVVSMADPGAKVGGVKITLNGASGSSVKGTGVSGTGPYTTTTIATSASKVSTANFVLDFGAGNIGDQLTVQVSLLDASKAEFSPPVERNFVMQRARLPERMALRWDRGDLAAGETGTLPVGVDYPARIVIHDPDAQVGAFTFTVTPSDFSLKGSHVSSSKLTGLTAPDADGNREVELDLHVVDTVSASTMLTLTLTAVQAVASQAFTPAVQSVFKFQAEMKPPTVQVLSDNKEIISADHHWAESFTSGSNHDLVVRVEDQNSQVGQVSISFNTAGFSLQGSGVSGSGRNYTLDSLPTPDASTGNREVTVQLAVDSSVTPLAPALLKVTLLKSGGADFLPQASREYAVQRDILTGWAVRSVGGTLTSVRTKENLVFYVGNVVEVGSISPTDSSITWLGANTPPDSLYGGAKYYRTIALATNKNLSDQGNRIFVFSTESASSGVGMRVFSGTYGRDGQLNWDRVDNLGMEVQANDAAYYDGTSSGVLAFVHVGLDTFLFTPGSGLSKVSHNSMGYSWDLHMDGGIILVGSDFGNGLAIVPFDPVTGKLETGTKVVTSNGIDVGQAVDTSLVSGNLILLATKTMGVILGERDPVSGKVSWLHQYAKSTGYPFESDRFQSIELVEGKYVLGLIKGHGIYLGVLDQDKKTISWKSEYRAGAHGVPSEANYNRSSSDRVLIIGTNDGKVITAVIDK